MSDFASSTARPFVDVGTIIRVQGSDYLVTKKNPKTFHADRLSDGRPFTIPRSMQFTVVSSEDYSKLVDDTFSQYDIVVYTGEASKHITAGTALILTRVDRIAKTASAVEFGNHAVSYRRISFSTIQKAKVEISV